MQNPIESEVDIFDDALMKRVFEEHLLPLCRGDLAIQKCRRDWSKHDASKRTSSALYHVKFSKPGKTEVFTRWLYLFVPGESRIAPGMPERRQLQEQDSSVDDDLQVSYLYLPPMKLLIQICPTDTRLPQLRTLVDHRSMTPHFQAYPGLNEMTISGITAIKYKPEHRCVIKYDLSIEVEHCVTRYGYFNRAGQPPCLVKRSLIGKTFCDDRGQKIFRTLQ